MPRWPGYVKPRLTIEARFWRHVTPLGPDDCWLWQGSTFHYKDTGEPSYGRMQKGGRGEGFLKSHRVSWTIHYGPVPDEAMVLHRCNVKLCCNPNHLYLGGNADNMRDLFEARGYNNFELWMFEPWRKAA